MYKCQRSSAIVLTCFGRVGQYKLRTNRYKASLVEFGITKESSPSLRNAYKTLDGLFVKVFQVKSLDLPKNFDVTSQPVKL